MRCEVRDQQLKREEKSDRQVRFMRTHFVSIVLKKPLTVSRSCCIVASTPWERKKQTQKRVSNGQADVRTFMTRCTLHSPR